MQVETTQCCVVGAGPGGMVLALLLARQGIDVLLLEAHRNFEREFRGDGVHPSTLELIDELGLMDRLLALRHVRGSDFPIHAPDGKISPPVRRRVPSRFPESLAARQTHFLEMLADAGRDYPAFRLVTGARVDDLITEDGEVVGVRYRGPDGAREVRAQLVVGADGRFSKVRQLANITLHAQSRGWDLLSMRLPKSEADPPRAYGLYPGYPSFLVVSDRAIVWHVGLGFPRGTYQELRQAGIESVRQIIAERAPWMADRVHLLESWSQTSLLVVQLGRVARWHRPGLLLIGDAAHVMSPVFGVGINYAIQDAIVAANVLGRRLVAGKVRSRDLAAVQRRREWPTRIMQWLQTLGELEALPGPAPFKARIAQRLLDLPPLRDIKTRLIAFGGLRPEHLRPPSRPSSFWDGPHMLPPLAYPWLPPVVPPELVKDYLARQRAP
jgi:2-polyprenyl-6-methoxyphenol hydroxylase-like FAD-dependent oxidoreductase